ncbi:hypothetical protein [Novimethylophilus kurashikiensis]|uniref:hypothetical protein n=1 Tax=Novimethylophilus kurashikiensis TaxID=1825523 RepID=UPI0011B2687C|nr:hypothetical protein [Novimethylophilus kurashikiensis]
METIQLGTLAARPRKKVAMPADNLGHHLLLSGVMGSGSTKLLESVLVQRTQGGHGWFYVDTRENYDMRDVLFEAAHHAGRQDEFHFIDLSNYPSWDVFDLWEGTPHELAEDFTALLPHSEPSTGSDYYRQLNHHRLTVIISALRASGLSFNLYDLAVAVVDLGALEQLAMKTPEWTPAAQELKGLIETYRDFGESAATRYRQDTGHLGYKLAELAKLLFSDDASAPTMRRKRQVSLKEIFQQNQLCYIMLPFGADNSLPPQLREAFGRFLLSKIRHAAVSRAQVPARVRKHPFLLGFDGAELYPTSSLSALLAATPQYGVGVALRAGLECFRHLPGSVVDHAVRVIFKQGSLEDTHLAEAMLATSEPHRMSENVQLRKRATPSATQVADLQAGEFVIDTRGLREVCKLQPTERKGVAPSARFSLQSSVAPQAELPALDLRFSEPQAEVAHE